MLTVLFLVRTTRGKSINYFPSNASSALSPTVKKHTREAPLEVTKQFFAKDWLLIVLWWREDTNETVVFWCGFCNQDHFAEGDDNKNNNCQNNNNNDDTNREVYDAVSQGIIVALCFYNLSVKRLTLRHAGVGAHAVMVSKNLFF